MGILWKEKPRPKPKRRRRPTRPVQRKWDAVLGRIAERMEQVRRAENLSRRQFASRLGMHWTTYQSMIATGRPTLPAVCGAAMAFGINPRWLVDGHGEQRIRLQNWYEADRESEV